MKELVTIMEAVSRRGYSAEWMDGLEFALWRIANNGGGKYGRTTVSEAEAKAMLVAAAHSQSWVVADDAGQCSALPLSDWLLRYGDSRWLSPQKPGAE